MTTGRIIALQRGVYASTDVLTGQTPRDRRRHLATRSAGAVLSQNGSVASHRSAAALADLPILTTPLRPCATVAPSSRALAPGVHLHRATLRRPDDVVLASAIMRTTSARTVVDIARESGIDEAVVVADAALHRGMTDHSKLAQALERCHHWPGIDQARQAVARCDGRAESPLESISRLRIADSDLPDPQPQVDIFDHLGHFLGRTDFYWEDFGVAGEADGMEKYDDTSAAPLRREKLRQEFIERTGLIVVRWVQSDLLYLAEFYARIRRNLLRGSRLPVGERRWVARASEFSPIRE